MIGARLGQINYNTYLSRLSIFPDFGGFNIVVGSTQLKPRLAGNFAWWLGWLGNWSDIYMLHQQKHGAPRAPYAPENFSTKLTQVISIELFA